MKLRVIWVGKSREAWLKEALAEYGGRIRRYVPFEVAEVREEKGAAADEMRRRECERLERLIPSSATVILLDERGDRMDSPGLAGTIGTLRDRGTSELLFVIGGAYGFSEDFRRRGRLLSLSPMTFTHQMARLFLLEQIYRAFTILNNEPYHH